MALKPCGECGTEISHRARKCPHCGIAKPFKPKAQRALDDIGNSLIGCGCALIILVPLVLLIISAIAAAF